MSVSRLVSLITALKGSVPTNAQTVRIASRFYVLTENPDPTTSNDEKALVVLNFIISHLQPIHDAGVEAIEKDKSIETIKAAVTAAKADF